MCEAMAHAPIGQRHVVHCLLALPALLLGLAVVPHANAIGITPNRIPITGGFRSARSQSAERDRSGGGGASGYAFRAICDRARQGRGVRALCKAMDSSRPASLGGSITGAFSHPKAPATWHSRCSAFRVSRPMKNTDRNHSKIRNVKPLAGTRKRRAASSARRRRPCRRHHPAGCL
jgi:hypothetical protein